MEAVTGQGDMAQVGDQQGDKVVSHHLQLVGGVQDGHAGQEEEPVRISKLLGHETAVLRRCDGEGPAQLLPDEPIRVEQGRDGANKAEPSLLAAGSC